MLVVSLLSRKGGAGKTTLMVNWAVEAEQKGKKRVVLVDMDAQKSGSSWFAKRKADTPLLIPAQPSNIRDCIEACRNDDIDLVLIDTSPDIDVSAVHAARVSDLVIIPARPSVLDLEAIGGTVELIKGVGKPGAIALNQAPSNSTVAAEAKIALAAYGLPICPVAIGNRIAFSRAMIDGRTAKELDPNSKAAAEIRQSWDWILKLLRSK